MINMKRNKDIRIDIRMEEMLNVRRSKDRSRFRYMEQVKNDEHYESTYLLPDKYLIKPF